jgi:hypothetical protein
MPSREGDGKWKVHFEPATGTKEVPILFTEMLGAVALSLYQKHSRTQRPARISNRSGAPVSALGRGVVCLLEWKGIGRENMKKVLLSIALAAAAPFAWAQVSETTTTTTTTEGNGTITEFTPGSAIVLKESTGPRHYRFGKTVTYVTRSGKVLDEDTVRTRVKVGLPVRVHYTGTGDDLMVDRVIVDED